MKKILWPLLFAFLAVLPLTVFAANNLGTLTESIPVGKTLSIGLNPSSTGNWYVTTNSNSAIAGAALSSGAVLVKGLMAGTTAITVCTDTQGTNCLLATVTVTPGGNVLGESITLPHKPGSWVLSGTTVYYVTSSGLIPIPTWKIFLSNHGTASLIQPANSSDLSLKLLPLMKLHDSRVK